MRGLCSYPNAHGYGLDELPRKRRECFQSGSLASLEFAEALIGACPASLATAKFLLCLRTNGNSIWARMLDGQKAILNCYQVLSLVAAIGVQ